MLERAPVEGLFVSVLSLCMFCVVLIFFFSGSSTKICPRCKEIMVQEAIKGGRIWACRVCGYIQRVKNKGKS